MQSADAVTPEPTYGTRGELEQALHGAVLPERAVEDREDDVDGPERRRCARARDGQRLARAAAGLRQRARRAVESARCPAAGSSQRPSRPIPIVVTS